MRIKPRIFLLWLILMQNLALLSQSCPAQPSLVVRTGWDYATNSYFSQGSLDPYWTVVQDEDPLSIEPRPSFHNTSVAFPGYLNSGVITNVVNNWCCQSYTNTCTGIPNTPCTANPYFYPPGYAPPGSYPDMARVFNFTFCINPGTNLSALQLNFAFLADDYAKVCFNGNYIGYGIASVINNYSVNNFFQIGINIISVQLYNLGWTKTYFYVDGTLTSSTPGAFPFAKPSCCGPSRVVCGQKFFDANNNGIKDAGETTIPAWTINLKDNLNNIVATTQTDISGNYFFNFLPLNNYVVEEVSQWPFYQTYPGSLYNINFNTSQIITGRDFGNAQGPCCCPTPVINLPGLSCMGLVTLSASACPQPLAHYIWDFGDGANVIGLGPTVTHNYVSPGTYLVTLTVEAPNQPAGNTVTQYITVNSCEPPSCTNCIGSFAPDPGDYMVSTWVREDISPQPLTYANARLNIDFTGDPTVYSFATNSVKNKIIEGWQKIEEPFTIPPNATYLNMKLVNTVSLGGPDAFFDDIRIYPKDGQMKTYVYDPVTLRLTAMLDENNYATLYEYDEEGKLIRVKKETEKGIMTTQENRENLKKK
jgi:hypothetical protein